MSGTDSTAQPPAQQQVTNRDRRPAPRKTSARAIFSPTSAPAADAPTEYDLDTSDPNAGGGRSFWYEWELADMRLQDEIDNIVVGGIPSYTHHQTVPSQTWVINHQLGLMPNVVLMDDSGHQMIAEIQYPSDQTVLVVHSAPYTGTAYLRP